VKTFLFRVTPAAALVALGWLAPSIEAAARALDDASAVRSRAVFYGDLNLRSEVGVARLHARIARAARSVCGGTTRSTLAETLSQSECRATAVADAVTSANHPLLTRYHAERMLLASR